MTYNEAKALYSKARDKSKGKLLPGRLGQTRLVNCGIDDKGKDVYAVQFHATKIVKIYADGSYVLTNGGYYTPSTKERLNLYGPVAIGAQNNKWYFSSNGATYNFRPLGSVYRPEIKISAKGKVYCWSGVRWIVAPEADVQQDAKEYRRKRYEARKELARWRLEREKAQYPERFTPLYKAVNKALKGSGDAGGAGSF